jgi:Zn-dependent oligopeptidase
MNSLLENSSLPYSAIDFNSIKESEYLPAVEKIIQDCEFKLTEFKESKEDPSFDNTIIFLENFTDKLDQVTGVFFNLYYAHTVGKMQELADQISEKLTKFNNDLLLDEKVFEKVKNCFDNKEKFNLDEEEHKLLTESYDDFLKNGALLENTEKEKLREFNQRLAKLSLSFSNNVLSGRQKFKLEVNSEGELNGLPESFIKSSWSEESKSWVFTLQAPSYIPFMKYAKNRELRKQMHFAYTSQCYEGENDNVGNVLEIVNLRNKKANLLGFKNHAAFVLKDSMAKTSQNVFSLLDELHNVAYEKALEELTELKEFALKVDKLEDLSPWDFSYYLELYKKEKFNFNDEVLKPYFLAEKSIKGVFEVASLLYDLEFEKLNDLPKYHEDVEIFKVTQKNTKEYIGLLYVDMFARPEKKPGAWMTSFSDQLKLNDQDQRPHVSIVCNFTRSTKDTPSLLTLDEVLTLFHEFGHALHGLLSNVKYRSLSGTNVFRDFVELPSQILENWVYQKDCLDLFAQHYQTGEKIPEELVSKIVQSSNFFEAYYTIRQLTFCYLDMAWHTVREDTDVKFKEFEQKAIEKCRLFPTIENTSISCQFSHIFAGGYSAGYYSYKWSEVLDADAFELFLEEGIFNKVTAQSFRDNILSKGGSKDPMTLYQNFRGRGPETKALLKRAGLLT